MIGLKSKDWNLKFHSKKLLNREQRTFIEAKKKGLKEILHNHELAFNNSGLNVSIEFIAVPAMTIDEVIQYKIEGHYILFEPHFLTVWRYKDDPRGPIGMVYPVECNTVEIEVLRKHFASADIDLWRKK